MVNTPTPPPFDFTQAVQPDAPVPTDDRERPRSEVTRNAAIVGVVVVILTIVLTFAARGITTVSTCTAQLATITVAEGRYRADTGKFGGTIELVYTGRLKQAPKHFTITTTNNGRRVRVRGTGDCDSVDWTQDNKLTSG